MPPQLRTCRPIPVSNPVPSKLSFTVMSYNILAQALIKRELFPHSGDILKWKTRKTMLLTELKEYKPDVMCLQEVDHVEDFYGEALQALGYSFEFCKHPSKLHGCLIAFKNEIFSKLRYDEIDYDTYTAFPPTRPTGNIAQCLALKFHGHNEGIVVGNTHLYWRPESFYERLRQGSIYIQSSYENLLSVKGMHSNVKWNYVLAGDLNTTPTDPTYPSLTRNSLTPIQEAWLEWSRREFDEGEAFVDDILDTAMPPPKPSEANDTHLATASELRKLIHDTLPLKSVYTNYSAVDKDDTQLYGEPKYTHYGTYFKGTLDYIFIPPHGDIVCRELLPIPKANEMEPGLPNPLFGSDHVPLLCSLHILNKTKQ